MALGRAFRTFGAKGGRLTARHGTSAELAVLLAYRLRTVKIAVQSTVLALGAMVIYALLPGHGHIEAASYIALVAVAAGGCALMARLPWHRLFDAGYGMRCLYAWSAMDIVLVTAAVAVTGHADSPLWLVYVFTTIFFAASYPLRGQAALLAFTFACYVGDIGASGWDIGASELFIRLASLAIVNFMTSFLSRELMQETRGHVEAREESETRATLLAKVAGAARSMSTLDSSRVLDIVVTSVVDIGFEGAEICMFNEAKGTWSVPYRRGISVDYELTQPAEVGLAGEVRRRRQTVVLEDYTAWEGGLAPVRNAGFRTTVATPVWSGSDLVGVLIAGTFARRSILPYESECLELLAAQVGAALVNARRYTERAAFEAELQHQAFHDSLTGLPNRALFVDRLNHSLNRAARGDSSVGVLFLDLDRFKTINDSLGHDVGDLLLRDVATRLKSCLRPGDTLSRYGGDEFTILLESLEDGGAVTVAERILDVLRAPFHLAGRQVLTSASIGIAFAPSPFGDESDPMREADLAMYRAKERGRGRWEIFQPEMNARALSRLQSETELTEAIEGNQFTVYYQPLVSLRSGLVTGVEALVRWQHPRRGLVSPADFIPLAEETGGIVRLGRWVLEEACRQAAAWARDGVFLQLHVNLSAVQFQQRDLVAQVAEALATAGLDASQLTLEITEGVVMQDIDATVDVMAELRRLGVLLALDDFGRGYSSLSYLKRFPLQTVKIDKAFVEGLVQSPEDQAIVRSVVMLASEMNMTVTAEGIESYEQLEHVRLLGCDDAQGYYLSGPLPGVAIPAAASPDIATLVAIAPPGA